MGAALKLRVMAATDIAERIRMIELAAVDGALPPFTAGSHVEFTTATGHTDLGFMQIPEGTIGGVYGYHRGWVGDHNVVSVGFNWTMGNHVTPPKPTFAVTAIQPRFEFLALRRIVRLAQNRFPLGVAIHRKGVVELKGDKLRNARCIEVRQITPLMPAAKAFFQFFNGRFPIPFAFRANQFEQAEILRRRATNWSR